MKKFSTILLISVLAVFLAVGSAMAVPVDVTGLNLTELQDVFTNIDSSITASGSGHDETQDEVFSFQSSGATATYVASMSWYQGYELEFGMYDVTNSDTRLTLFNTDPDWPILGQDAQIYINYNVDNTVTSYTMNGGYNEIDTETFATANLGFYITSFDYPSGAPYTYLSQSDLNANGMDRFLTYMGQGDLVDIDQNPVTDPLNDFAHWYIAAESGSSSVPADYDFSDFVVQVESVQPVPEPATMLLLGSGLLGLAGFGRKKFRK